MIAGRMGEWPAEILEGMPGILDKALEGIANHGPAMDEHGHVDDMPLTLDLDHGHRSRESPRPWVRV